MSKKMYGWLVGGGTRAGKGRWSESTYEALVGLYENTDAVNIVDQGATFRYSLLRAFKAGCATKPEVQRHTLNEIATIDPQAFLEQFLHTFYTSKEELYAPRIGDQVAQIGQLDEAQYFFTDLLNLRIEHAKATGVEAIVVDSRTPGKLILPSVESGVIVPVLEVYIDTPMDTAAKRESARTGKSYQECLGSIVARTELDNNRSVYPAVTPEPARTVILNKQTERSVLSGFIDGSNLGPDQVLLVDNGQSTKLGELRLWASITGSYACKNVVTSGQ